MDEFLGAHKLPKLNQEETENLNRPITSKETELVIKKLTEKKAFTGQFYQKLKVELASILHKLFQKPRGRDISQLIL